jgi:hypothetical protein
MGGFGIRILKNLPPMGGQGTEWVKLFVPVAFAVHSSFEDG